MKIETATEYARWRDVISLLRNTGAVTEDDLEVGIGNDETDGQRLFAAIAEWGEALVSLRGTVQS